MKALRFFVTSQRHCSMYCDELVTVNNKVKVRFKLYLKTPLSVVICEEPFEELGLRIEQCALYRHERWGIGVAADFDWGEVAYVGC
jgi:hypothetical protein